MKQIKIKQIDPRFHTHVLGLASVAAAFTIVSAGAPYLLAQTDYTQPVPDTILTAPLPVDQQPVNTQPPSSGLIPTPAPIQEPGTAMVPCVPPGGSLPPDVQLPPGTTAQPCPTGSSGGQFGQGQPTGKQMPPGERQPMGQPNGGDGQDVEQFQEFIDPREVKNALKEIARMTTELNRFAKRAKQLPEVLTQIQSLKSKLQEFKNSISQTEKQNDAGELRSAMQEFWDAQPWEEVNKIRVIVELPRELKLIDRELKKLEKLAASKTFPKVGLDVEILKENLRQLREAYNAALAAQKGGDSEEVMEVMEVFHEGGHPGEISSVIYRLRDIRRFTKTIKDKEVQEQINEILQPIIDSFNKGEFRDARELMDDTFDEMTKLANLALRIQRRRVGNRDDMVDKFQALEEKIMAKLEKFEADDEKREVEQKKVNTTESQSP